MQPDHFVLGGSGPDWSTAVPAPADYKDWMTCFRLSGFELLRRLIPQMAFFRQLEDLADVAHYSDGTTAERGAVYRLAVVPISRGRQAVVLRAGLLAVALPLAFALACGNDESRLPVGPSPTTNRTPVATGSIPAQTLVRGESAGLDMAGYFSDPDGDALTYGATSSDAHIATVSVSDSTVSVTAEDLGQADIRVSAIDPQSASAALSFRVTVEAPGFEAPKFTLSGTVSDRRRNGQLIAGAAVKLDTGEETTTSPDGRYHLPNVSGRATVTVTADS